MFLSSLIHCDMGGRNNQTTMFIFMMHDTYLDRVRKQLYPPRKKGEAVKLNMAMILWANGDNVTTEY